MITKTLTFTTLLIVAYAQHHGHESHGHAVSSQSIVHHNVAHEYNNIQPVHAAPIVHHQAPLVHAAPLISVHHAPAVHHIPVVHHSASIYENQHGQAHGHEDYYAHPKYEFEYSVADTHTGDIKSQHEARDGDHVTGSYSLHEADGTIRTVHYNDDGHSGFNANVERTGHATHIQPAAQHGHY